MGSTKPKHRLNLAYAIPNQMSGKNLWTERNLTDYRVGLFLSFLGGFLVWVKPWLENQGLGK